MANLSYPNESKEYRQARNALLAEEIALRARTEALAAKRRALPPGGEVKEDYEFEQLGENGMPEKVKMSELFGRYDTLMLYSFMYGPDREEPCPGCTHMLDAVDGAARHLGERAALYVVAKSPIARLVEWARTRVWPNLTFLSTAGNSYDADYFGDTTNLPAGMRKDRGLGARQNWDEPMLNVFTLDQDMIRHFWGSELTFAPPEEGQHHRSSDTWNALWGLLDTTPEGRGQFMPKLSY